MGYEISGVIGFVVLLLNIWAILKIVGSGASTLSKVVWIAIVLILPIIGFIAWFVLGPKS